MSGGEDNEVVTSEFLERWARRREQRAAGDAPVSPEDNARTGAYLQTAAEREAAAGGEQGLTPAEVEVERLRAEVAALKAKLLTTPSAALVRELDAAHEASHRLERERDDARSQLATERAEAEVHRQRCALPDLRQVEAERDAAVRALAQAVANAVAEEREACARIAEEHYVAGTAAVIRARGGR